MKGETMDKEWMSIYMLNFFIGDILYLDRDKT